VVKIAGVRAYRYTACDDCTRYWVLRLYGKVERSHRIDADEFWGRHDFPDFSHAAEALRGWEHVYNSLRFSMALRGLTPAEKLARHVEAA